MIVDKTMERTLANVLKGVPGLVGIVLADAHGLPVFSTLARSEGVSEAASLTAVAVDVARRVALQLELGDFESLTFSFHNRYLYVSSLAEGNAHLLVLAKKNVNVSLMNVALDEIRSAIEGYLDDFVYVRP